MQSTVNTKPEPSQKVAERQLDDNLFVQNSVIQEREDLSKEGEDFNYPAQNADVLKLEQTRDGGRQQSDINLVAQHRAQGPENLSQVGQTNGNPAPNTGMSQLAQIQDGANQQLEYKGLELSQLQVARESNEASQLAQSPALNENPWKAFEEIYRLNQQAVIGPLDQNLTLVEEEEYADDINNLFEDDAPSPAADPKVTAQVELPNQAADIDYNSDHGQMLIANPILHFQVLKAGYSEIPKTAADHGRG